MPSTYTGHTDTGMMYTRAVWCYAYLSCCMFFVWVSMLLHNGLLRAQEIAVLFRPNSSCELARSEGILRSGRDKGVPWFHGQTGIMLIIYYDVTTVTCRADQIHHIDHVDDIDNMDPNLPLWSLCRISILLVQIQPKIYVLDYTRYIMYDCYPAASARSYQAQVRDVSTLCLRTWSLKDRWFLRLDGSLQSKSGVHNADYRYVVVCKE